MTGALYRICSAVYCGHDPAPAWFMQHATQRRSMSLTASRPSRAPLTSWRHIASAMTSGMRVPQAAAQTTLDAGVLNYMLNVEYLMAEFYACAVTGAGLAAPLRLGGPPSVGCQKAALTGTVAVRPGHRALLLSPVLRLRHESLVARR